MVHPKSGLPRPESRFKLPALNSLDTFRGEGGRPVKPLIVLLGPTGSGKTALALALARHFAGEILSCDSVAVYRYMQLGTAKPTAQERALVPHHLLDLYDPDQSCTAGDWARHARATLASISARGALPIVAGGTGLYARALLDGLFPAPPRDPGLRALLRYRAATRGPHHLHRTLRRFDPQAAAAIHPHDTPKIIRAVEVSVAARRPITGQWQQGRDALTGYSILRLTLSPPRPELYARLNQRAAAMFAAGLLEETRELIQRFGPECRPFSSLGYAQAAAVLRDEMTEQQAITATQQGHRNYAKRQMTWFRRESELHPTSLLAGNGASPEIVERALGLAQKQMPD